MLAGIYNCLSKVLRRGPVQIWLVRQQSRAASRATSKAVSRVELSPEFGAEQGRAESRVQRSLKTHNNETKSHISSCGPKQCGALGQKNLAPPAERYKASRLWPPCGPCCLSVASLWIPVASHGLPWPGVVWLG